MDRPSRQDAPFQAAIELKVYGIEVRFVDCLCHLYIRMLPFELTHATSQPLIAPTLTILFWENSDDSAAQV